MPLRLTASEGAWSTLCPLAGRWVLCTEMHTPASPTLPLPAPCSRACTCTREAPPPQHPSPRLTKLLPASLPRPVSHRGPVTPTYCPGGLPHPICPGRPVPSWKDASGHTDSLILPELPGLIVAQTGCVTGRPHMWALCLVRGAGVAQGPVEGARSPNRGAHSLAPAGIYLRGSAVLSVALSRSPSLSLTVPLSLALSLHDS